MKALVFKGKIIQIEAEEFPVSSALIWVNLTGIAPPPQVNWLFDGTIFTPPLPPIPDPPKSAIPLTVEELADLLISKAVITQGEITNIKQTR